MTKNLIQSIVDLIAKQKVEVLVKYNPANRGKDTATVYKKVGKESSLLTCGELGSVYHWLVGYYNGVKYHGKKSH